jgi:peptidoglycan/xylan/chitin deacetylase (PgdA/CDA1 family)
MYHHIAATVPAGFRKYTVAPDDLDRQLRWLASRRMGVVDLDMVAAVLAGGPPLESRSVVLTFDDGFAGAVSAALPILERHGVRATFYIVSDGIGGRSDWLRRERGVDLPLVDAPGVRRLVDAGMAVESHTRTHPHLPRLEPGAIADELRGSREAIERLTGAPVRHLAYPHGEANEIVRSAAQAAGYRTATTTEQRLTSVAGDAVRDRGGSLTEDPLALPRVIVDGRDTIADFALRLRVGEDVRSLLRRGPIEAGRRIVKGPRLDRAAPRDAARRR